MRCAQYTCRLRHGRRNRNSRRRPRSLCAKNVCVLAKLIRRGLHDFHDGVLEDAVPHARNNDIPRESPRGKRSRIAVTALGLLYSRKKSWLATVAEAFVFSNNFFYQDLVDARAVVVMVVRVGERLR